ncbi:hypothetical protein O9929_17010 [Vibrio lentus]|nr:hypothetical protein [Vibrio lentus]
MANQPAANRCCKAIFDQPFTLRHRATKSLVSKRPIVTERLKDSGDLNAFEDSKKCAPAQIHVRRGSQTALLNRCALKQVAMVSIAGKQQRFDLTKALTTKAKPVQTGTTVLPDAYFVFINLKSV